MLANLRRVQAITAFQNTLRLGPETSQALRAHALLETLFREMGSLDLALEHAQAYLRITRDAGRTAGESADAFQDRIDRLERNVERLAEQVRSDRELYDANSKNLRVFDRAQFAKRKNLGGQALKVLLASDYAAFGAQGMALELTLLLETGQADKVRKWMDSDQIKPLGPDVYYWLQIQAKAARGEYAGADADLTILRGAPAAKPGQKTLSTRAAMAAVIGRSILEGTVQGTSLFETVRVPLSRQLALQQISQMAASLRRQADLVVLRGVLRLERGETIRAVADFREALAFWRNATAAAAGSGLDFTARPVAEGYWRLASDW
jgi:hypothetical protein